MPSLKKKKVAPTMPAKCVWGLICSLSSIDQERNNISLFNVIDEISVPQKIFEHHTKENKPLLVGFPHEIVLLWKRSINVSEFIDELRADLKLKTRDPKGNIVQEIFSTITFPKNRKRLRFRIKLNSMLITTPGDYQYDIEVKSEDSDTFERVCELPFEVKSKN